MNALAWFLALAYIGSAAVALGLLLRALSRSGRGYNSRVIGGLQRRRLTEGSTREVFPAVSGDPNLADEVATALEELIADVGEETRSELSALRDVVLRARADVAEDRRIRDVDSRQARERAYALEASITELANALGFSETGQRSLQVSLPYGDDRPGKK